jgi:glycosyltransferase involved in cell wall biosynthesis
MSPLDCIDQDGETEDLAKGRNREADLSGLLEICIITYNRASYLERTLKSLLESPFRHVKINILDNCSSDSTPEIIAQYRIKYPNIHLLRHHKNIGGLGNIMRAMETPIARYSWILCDDDILNFEHADDLIDALQSDAYDSIIVGVPGNLPFKWGTKSNFKLLFELNANFFRVLSFLPSTIYRTSLLSDRVIQKGYYIVGDWFPHMAISGYMLHINASIYTVVMPLVKQDYAQPYFWTEHEFLACWVRTCSKIIPSSTVRRKAIYDMFDNKQHQYGPLPFLWRMLSAIIVGRADAVYVGSDDFLRRQSLFESFCQIFSGCVWDQRILLGFCIPFLLFPTGICVIIIKVYLWIRTKVLNKPAPRLFRTDNRFW